MSKHLDFLIACGFEVSNNKDGSYKIKHEDSSHLDGIYTDLELFIKELDENYFESVGFYGVDKKLLLSNDTKSLDQCYIK